ncbi:MAG: hypothetical protein ACRCSO_04735 [Sphingomonas sp.]
MRFAYKQSGWMMVALAALSLGGCEATDAGKANTDGASSTTPDQSVLSGDFDYRLAFRLPPPRIAQVQDAHVRLCDQLGPQRCRVTTVRYHVGSDNQVTALLSLMIDPAIARSFSHDADKLVNAGGGLLVDSRMAGSDAPGADTRTGNVVARLRNEITTIDTQLSGPLAPPQKAALIDKQNRLRAAIQTIGEVDQRALQGTATAAVLVTYGSGNALPALGGSASASFDAAGETFISSLAGLTQVLAGIGPWLVVLIGGALLLRRILPQDEPAAPAAPTPPVERREGGIIERILGRREEHAEEHQPAS